MDDYPIHQTSQPLAHPSTTDRHFYDRYWFNGYDEDAAFYFGIGAALYPNLGVFDAHFSLVIDGEQHAFHASRRASGEPSDLRVGPWNLEIQEPMKRLRLTIDDNTTGISGELQWIPRTANVEEGHQLMRRRIAPMQATRFNQFGRWDGEIRFDGRSLRVRSDQTFGTKDRSWGVRPVGDPAPPGAPPEEPAGISFIWAPLQWRDRCTHMGCFENEHGVPWHFDGMICPVYDDPADIPGTLDPATEILAGGDHQLSFIPGTRRARSAELTLKTMDGRSEEIQLEPRLCFRMKGIGYQHPEWGHGRWKGELAMAGEKWKCDDLDEMAFENLHVQQVVRATSGDQIGVGVLEQIHLGPQARYGFKEFLDPAS